MNQTNQLQGNWTIVSLEPGTCTERAAQKFAAQSFTTKPAFQFTNTFDEGIEFCRQNTNCIILLPHLHHLCSDLECDSKWQSKSELAFFLENPPIYLAENKNESGKSCAAINTLTKLLDGEGLEFIKAENTQQAAKMAANGQCHYCITNQVGLEKNKLLIVKELKKMTVCWIPLIYLDK